MISLMDGLTLVAVVLNIIIILIVIVQHYINALRQTQLHLREIMNNKANYLLLDPLFFTYQFPFPIPFLHKRFIYTAIKKYFNNQASTLEEIFKGVFPNTDARLLGKNKQDLISNIDREIEDTNNITRLLTSTPFEFLILNYPGRKKLLKIRKKHLEKKLERKLYKNRGAGLGRAGLGRGSVGLEDTLIYSTNEYQLFVSSEIVDDIQRQRTDNDRLYQYAQNIDPWFYNFVQNNNMKPMYDLFLSSASVCQKDKLYTKQGTTYTIIKQELFEDLLDRSFQKLR